MISPILKFAPALLSAGLLAWCQAGCGGGKGTTTPRDAADAQQPDDAGVADADAGASDTGSPLDAPVDTPVDTPVNDAAPADTGTGADRPATGDGGADRGPDARVGCQPTILPAGYPALDVALLEYTADGVPDLFVPEGDFSGPARLSVAVGDGTGGFGPLAVFETMARTVRGAAGDFDGDGLLDVAAMASAGVVEFMRGLGNGMLGAPAGRQSFAGSLWDMVVADFNGDGRPDLALGASEPGRVEVILGQGAGTFATPLIHPFGTLDSTFKIILGDFNEDRRPDLLAWVAATVGDRAMLLLGQGNGSFAAQQIFSIVNPSGLATGDVNKDGHEDLVATFGANLLTVQLGNGQGTFSGVAGVRPNTRANSRNPVIADVSGDGIPDVITTNMQPVTMSILRGRGDGTFEDGVVIPIYDQLSLSVGDLNRDGVGDIVTTEPNGAFIFLGPCP